MCTQSTVWRRAEPSLSVWLDRHGRSPTLEALVTECAAPIAEELAGRFDVAKRSLVVGLGGGQGTGKSTLAELLDLLLTHAFGLRSVVISIDDYYLPLSARRELAAAVHPLLATRGAPGTHDLDALELALTRLRNARAGEVVQLLCFSKAMDDRLPDTRRVEGPFDLVLFEGWCVGARPARPAELETPINALEREADPDGRLRHYQNRELMQRYVPLWRELDAYIFLAAPDIATVRVFRAQQERALRESDGAAPGVMDDAQLTRFVEYFERITLRMLRESPDYADVVVHLDAERKLRELVLE